MIEEKDIYRCIEENKAPHIRLYDTANNLLHIYDEGTDVQAAINHLQAVLPMFKGYGKIIVNCANESMRAARWAKSYYMNLHFEKTPGTPATIATPGFTPWNMPPGYVHQDVMMAKLASIEKSIALNRQIDDLKRAAEKHSEQDPMKQMEKIAPWAMYALGKPLDEIIKVTSAMRIGNANLVGTMPTLPAGSLTFKDIEAKPTEEKEKQFQTLADSISKKVCIEQMILLYDAINKDPEPDKLIQTALEALPLLKK